LVWLLALALVLACSPIAAAPVVATLDPNAVNTFIVQTANAASTQTAASLPSATPTATVTLTPRNTDTPSPTATSTVLFILSTPTPLVVPTFTGVSGNSSAKFACQVISVNPANGSVLSSRQDFDTTWKVKNIGKRAWDNNDVDYAYSSGTKFHKVSGYDLSKTLNPNATADFIVDIIAPKKPGTYTTNWVIREGGNNFCTLSLTIVVK